MKRSIKKKRDVSRLTLLKELLEQGYSIPDCAKPLGVSQATVYRYEASLRESGGDIEEAARGKRIGRPPVAPEPSPFERDLAKAYRLTKEKLPVAAYFFARDERVSEGLRETLLQIEEKGLQARKRDEYPMSIRRLFHVTDAEIAAHKGVKASQAVEMVTRRGMFEELADLSRVDILPGEVWELDDYSTNQPYHFLEPLTKNEMLGRQILGARDLCAAAWLGFDHIGRERDAYRGEDILRFIRRLMQDHGKPRKLRLERGIWEKSTVHGIAVKGMKGHWGDLADLVEIVHVFKSKSKSIIEGGFNEIQKWLSHTGVDIGRERGAFEEATRRVIESRQKGKSAADLGFVSQEDSNLMHFTTGQLVNSRPMHRGHLNERVSPDDLVARLGWKTTPLTAAEMWYFLPCKQERIVRGGYVEINPGGGWPKMRFCVNGVPGSDVYLETGYKVLIACDPSMPELGARVCNNETGVRNEKGYRHGEVLHEAAPWHDLAPQFSAAEILSPHLLARKKSNAAASTRYRGIRQALGTKKTGGEEATAFDGQGKAARISNLDQAPEAITNAVPPSVRQTRILPPATSSRGVREGTTIKEEIARLKAQFEAAEV